MKIRIDAILLLKLNLYIEEQKKNCVIQATVE